MKGAFEIFKRDLKNIFKNYGAIIVVMAFVFYHLYMLGLI